MTDTQIPKFVTHLDSDRAREYRAQVTYLHAKVEQAERAQADAEAAQYRAELKKLEEADRADGAEAFARALLDTHHITPAMQDLGIDPLVPTRADIEAIADALADDWKAGTEIDSLNTDTAVRDWATDRGLL